MKKINIIALVAIVIAGIGIFYSYFANKQDNNAEPVQNQVPIAEDQDVTTEKDDTNVVATTSPEVNNTPAETPTAVPDNKTETIIGKSVGGRDIVAYHFGAGDKEILLVGGIHGGYALNTFFLAKQIMDYLKANPGAISANTKVTVIPVLNPDGLYKVIGDYSLEALRIDPSQELRITGRFNANNVDLNRNFDCGWKASGVWQSKTVSGGTSAFSEPESAAIRDYVKDRKPTAVVAWYSAGGGVYSSSCGNGISAETQTITDLYAKASGYPAYKNFESYQVSGDMTDWFTKNNVPAIGVLLTTSGDAELNKNLAGVKAILDHYSK